MTTWSPTDKHSSVRLSNGNLTISSAGGNAPVKGFATESKPANAGKFYWELIIDSLVNGKLIAGVHGPTRASGLTVPGKTDSYGISWGNEGYNSANSGEEYIPASAYKTGDKLGFGLDTATGRLDCYKNGVLVWSPVTSFSSYLPFAAPYETDFATANFGASAPAYAPPSGYALYDAPQTITATSAITLAALGNAALSRIGVAAGGVIALGAIVAQSTGALAAAASAAATLQPLASAGPARLGVSANASTSLGDLIAVATAAPAQVVGASVASSLGWIASASTAQLIVAGAATADLGSVTARGAGATEIHAASAAVIDAIDASVAGRPTVTAVATSQLAAIASIASAGSQASLVATSTATLASIASSSTTQVTIAGATLANLGAISSSSGAAAPVRAAGATALGSVTSLAASRLELSAGGTAQFAQLGSISAGYVVTRAAASVLVDTVGGSASALAGDREPSAGIAGPCWTAVVRPRFFSAAVTPRWFTATSTGCKRMISFPGKYAHEIRHATVDFAPALAPGESLIGTPTVKVSRGTLTTSGARVDGSNVRLTLSGGSTVPQPVQRIEIGCATSTGQTVEEIVLVTMLSAP